MTEAEWQVCTQPEAMLWFVQEQVSPRKTRLFAVACCRRIWQILKDKEWQDALDVAERLAEGQLNDEQALRLRNHIRKLVRAMVSRGRAREDNITFNSARAVYMALQDEACFSGTSPSREYGTGNILETPFSAAMAVAHWNREDDADGIDWRVFEAESRKQAVVLREIAGNPFLEISAEPAWLAWNSGCVVKLAEAIYQERELPTGSLDNALLAILADALEDAGCANQDILGHCREQGGVHVRGCWVIDVLLGKE
jgi:hypothetical protein